MVLLLRPLDLRPPYLALVEAPLAINLPAPTMHHSDDPRHLNTNVFLAPEITEPIQQVLRRIPVSLGPQTTASSTTHIEPARYQKTGEMFAILSRALCLQGQTVSQILSIRLVLVRKIHARL
jgi:hypothetical protein